MSAERTPGYGGARLQQPDWSSHPLVADVVSRLRDSPELVPASETAALQEAIVRAASGESYVLQLGDCAENIHSTLSEVAEQTRFVLEAAEALAAAAESLVVPVARIAGQYGKPRSNLTEQRDGSPLPVFRGHIANSEVPTTAARRADPRRMLWAHAVAWRGQGVVRAFGPSAVESEGLAGGPWTSHEALVLDFEEAMVRPGPGPRGRRLTSTHLPWVGERTRDPEGAHVQLLASVDGPVACKVGPTATAAEVLRLCEVLDPDRSPGRLALILRMGRGRAHERVPEIVTRVHSEGHPVLWLSDPMHGNTVTLPDGTKTRVLEDVAAEALEVAQLLEECGAHPGGLHLEASFAPVTECLGAGVEEVDLSSAYRTLCDPRLNRRQTLQLVTEWGAARREATTVAFN